MKIVSFVLSLFFFAQCDAGNGRHEHSLSCILEENLDASRIDVIHDYVPEEDLDYVAYANCYWKKTGMLHDNGDFDFDEITKMVIDAISADGRVGRSPPKIAGLIVGQCREIDGDAHGVKAIRMRNCIERYRKMFVDKYRIPS